MLVIFHPHVQKDMDAILLRYTRIGRPDLADAFYEEFLAYVKAASDNPTRFHFYRRTNRRVNLKRFPYHFTYKISAFGIRVMLLRYNRRHPNFGMNRR